MATLRATDRLNVRLDPEKKGLIAQAADLVGLTLTGFTVNTLVERAQAIVDSHARITLLNADRDAFLERLASPRQPTAHLQRAAQRYKKRAASR